MSQELSEAALLCSSLSPSLPERPRLPPLRAGRKYSVGDETGRRAAGHGVAGENDGQDAADGREPGKDDVASAAGTNDESDWSGGDSF